MVHTVFTSEFDRLEIRHLSPTPFALVEVIADDIGEEIAEELLRATEQKMIGIIGKRRPAN